MKKKEAIGADWWRDRITRRDANKRLGKAGALAALMSMVGLGGCDSETVVETDALDLQQAQGWNFGTDRTLNFPDASAVDSTGSVGWSAFLDPVALLRAYQPRNARYQPYVVPTLVQSLSQSSLRSQVRPMVSEAMKEAYARGLGLKDILARSQNSETVIWYCDLPGPESIALAAALAGIVEPVLTFDNWPHPLGVVPSHHTLGALVYYAQEMQNGAATRPDRAPALLLLDSRRLNAYSDASDAFDNRYVARVPTAENLQTLGVSGVLYAVASEYQKNELDDLNDDFALYREKGLTVSMIPLNHFMKPAPTSATVDTAATTGAGQTAYYYGGGPSLWPWFFMHYAMMSSYRPFPTGYDRTRPPVQRPNYTPVRRPTVFSSRRVGGAAGIGKQKPSGFGRVSTSVSRSGGATRMRSGSFGRSRSGYSS